jgi:hypothetical protein
MDLAVLWRTRSLWILIFIEARRAALALLTAFLLALQVAAIIRPPLPSFFGKSVIEGVVEVGGGN